jgi:3-oxoacyl-[acyl-carrier protein] reductase
VRFTGKVAIVTGSGRGIGWKTVWRFAEEGAAVVVNDVEGERIEERVASLQRAGHTAIGAVADVTVEAQIAQMVDRTVTELGRVDILVNNVGGTYPSVKRFIEEFTLDDWEAIIELNLTSHFLCSRAVIPHMKRQRYGRIVNVSSIAGVAGEPGIWSPAYAAAKAGTLGLMRQMALELGHDGVLVNGVAQADVLSERTLEHLRGGWYWETEAEMRERFRRFPVPRPGEPEEVANVIAFLASDDASLITGETVLVTGGSYMAA